VCGLSGFFSFKEPTFKVRKNISDFIHQCVYIGGLRGRDSTGIFTIDRTNHEVSTIKAAVDGAMFIDNPGVSNHLTDLFKQVACVVHHRKASKGAINQANAHPFRVGPITLVHNGGVWAHRQLGKGNDCTVDSEAIAVALTQVSKTALLEELQGAYTLIWHDKRDNTINIAKNEERPLAIAAIKGESTVLFASEAGMLKWLAFRNDIELNEVFYPKSRVLFSWDLNDTTMTPTKYERTEYKEKVYVATPAANNTGAHHRSNIPYTQNKTVPINGNRTSFPSFFSWRLLVVREMSS
jgi:glucosamine 6-phosphate synthetase-like amidotransferase/phosphosugar isomerase protein